MITLLHIPLICKILLRILLVSQSQLEVIHIRISYMLIYWSALSLVFGRNSLLTLRHGFHYY